MCAKHCAECFAIIIPSNPYHKASTVTYFIDKKGTDNIALLFMFSALHHPFLPNF